MLKNPYPKESSNYGVKYFSDSCFTADFLRTAIDETKSINNPEEKKRSNEKLIRRMARRDAHNAPGASEETNAINDERPALRK